MSYTGMPTFGELRELNESRQVNVSRRGMTGYRKWLCRWEEQNVVFTDTSPLGSAFPGYDYLRMVSYRITPFGKSKGNIPGFEYDCALIEAEYATLTGPDDAPTSTWEGTCEVLEVGDGRLWLSDSSACDQPINMYLGLQIATYEYSIASSAIPAAVNTHLNHVNSVAFADHDAGTVLYECYSTRNEWDADLGAYRCRLSLRFIVRDRSHNEVWRGDLGDWDSTDPALYEEADLNELIPS